MSGGWGEEKGRGGSFSLCFFFPFTPRMKKEAGDSCEWDGKTRRLIARRREMKTNTRQCHRLARGGVGWTGGGGERGRGGACFITSSCRARPGSASRDVSQSLARSMPPGELGLIASLCPCNCLTPGLDCFFAGAPGIKSSGEMGMLFQRMKFIRLLFGTAVPHRGAGKKKSPWFRRL